MAALTDRTDALKRWGLTMDETLLEQMASQWEVRIDHTTLSKGYVVSWRGTYGVGRSITEAALDCIDHKTQEVTA